MERPSQDIPAPTKIVQGGLRLAVVGTKCTHCQSHPNTCDLENRTGGKAPAVSLQHHTLSFAQLLQNVIDGDRLSPSSWA